MKFQITSDCFLANGDGATAGDVVEVTGEEAKALSLAGRGYPFVEPEAVKEPAAQTEPETEPEAPAEAEAESKPDKPKKGK